MHASYRIVRTAVWSTLVVLLIDFPGAECCRLNSVSAAEPLHQQIDRLTATLQTGPVAGRIDDYTFARRLYLDLAGRIPSGGELRRFLEAPPETRRIQLIDRLLQSDEFADHMAVVFDVMLMERRGGKYVKTEDFRAWLRQAFIDNKSLHILAADLIRADTSQAVAAAAFFLERDAEPNLMTRDISRIFFGRDIQCAQCHDHPNVDDYRQEDYYGLFAFVNRTTVFQPDKKKPATLAESADGVPEFKSVFTDRSAVTFPRLPGEPEVPDPRIPAGREYKVRGTKTVAAVPVYSRRHKLAELIESGRNEYFRRNMSNRLWAMVMGRGLVHPVDMHHSSNSPTFPELAELLAVELAAMNFDLRAFLRELVLTDVYQRESRLAEDESTVRDGLEAQIAELERIRKAAAEQSSRATAAADAALDALDKAIASAEPFRVAWQKTRAAAVKAATAHQTAQQALVTSRKLLQARQKVAEELRQSAEHIAQAVALLGDSGELAGVRKTLQSRHSAVSAQVNKLQKEYESALAAERSSAEVLAAADLAEKRDWERLAPLQQAIYEHRSRLVTSWVASEEFWQRVDAAERRKVYLVSLRDRAAAKQKLPQAVAGAASARKEIRAAEDVVEDMTRQQAQLAAEMLSAEEQCRDMEGRMAETAETVSGYQTAIAEITDAVAHTRTAAELLGDGRLSESVGVLERVQESAVTEMNHAVSRLAGLKKEHGSLASRISELQRQLESAQQKQRAAQQRVEAATSRLSELQEKLQQLKSQSEESAQRVEQRRSAAFHRSVIEPLSPEQLAWSLLQATGQLDRYVSLQRAKLDKAAPLTAEQQKDAAFVAKRQQAALHAARAALQNQVKVFVGLFGAGPGQPQDSFFATVDQALFFANGAQVRSWLNPVGENLTARLLKLKTAEELARELYLSVLVRPPNEEEVRDVREYLAARGEKRVDAVQELAWALLTSAEFRFQY